MERALQIIEIVGSYLSSLDWPYIITFIIASYGINHYKVRESISTSTGKRMRTRYRVVLVGIVYGAILFFIRGYALPQIETLLQSFIFALVFHKLVIEALVYWLAKKGMPDSITKHLIDEEQLKNIHDEKQ